MDFQKKQRFMTAVRLVPAHRVAKALGRLTGAPWEVNWYGCSKGLMAENYAGRCPHPALRDPDFFEKLKTEIERLQTQR